MHTDKSIKERLVNLPQGRKNRKDFWALRDVDFDVTMGSTLGLVGHNGSGKSTLLKIVGGIIEPTRGSVSRRGRVAALLELGAGFHPDLTGKENVYLNAAILGLSRSETDRHFDSIVDFAGIEAFINTQVKFYSSGMYVRLAFSVAVHVDPDILLVDEVLAVGDEPFQRKCMSKIVQFQREGRTIVLVSHSSDQVGSLCDRVLVLKKGVVVHDGDPAKGIQVLRDGYDADRQKQLDEERLLALRSDTYSIVSMDARAVSVDGGTDIEAEIVVDVVNPQPDWGIGFSISNPLGMQLFDMTTFDLPPLPNTVGRHTINFRIPNAGLGGGQYLVNAGLGGSNGVNYDLMLAGASFEMPADAHGYRGIIRLDPIVRAS
ncbi:ABC transporter ATP-binding protein [Agreia sp. VKM Ac-1783]|jgi:ABC-2 type transport system ATP-binding protein|uniref:ABC transporter ATP-binding protein n=1 Tax=Agreia sp. VKM Ac-1783 TaxID=1938889 RepID=UPI002015FE18|nr:ABC transporter ATP-binding protein [Agreia sp. VKM Ac-1783]